MKYILRLSTFFIVVATIGVLILSTVIYIVMTQAGGDCGIAESSPASFRLQDTVPTDYLMTNYEDVTFTTADGLTLRAFYIPAPTDDSNAPTVIIAHGTGSCRRDKFSLLPAGMLHRAGFNTLVLDLRNMGESEDDNGHMGMGSKEYQDIIGAVDYLINERRVSPSIGVYGYSMGGATALIAGGFDARIQAIWADSAYSDLHIVIDDLLAQVNLPILKTPILFMARLLYQEDVTRYAPVDFATMLGDRPVYLVFGSRDGLVSPVHATRFEAMLSGADVPHTLWITDSGHVESILDQTDAYEARLVEFFSEALKARIED